MARYICFLMVLLSFPGKMIAEENSTGNILMHHVKDNHSWHFATIGHDRFEIHLPILLFSKQRGLDCFSSSRFFDREHHAVPYLGYVLDSHGHVTAEDTSVKVYDLSVTKNVAYLWLNVLLLLAILLWAARRYKLNKGAPPKGFCMFLEMIVCFVRDDIAIPNIGTKHYKRFMSYLLTVFFFIWFNNLTGLLPCAANITGNISVTLVLALFTFFVTNLNGNRYYWAHVFKTPGVPRWLSPLMIPIELIGLATKPFTLMLRLFANITAGHMILLSIVFLMFILKELWAGLISIPFGTFMFLLKLLVAFLQAYVFTLLSAIYFGSAVEQH